MHMWQEMVIVSQQLKFHYRSPAQFETIPIIEINCKLIHNFHHDNFL